VTLTSIQEIADLAAVSKSTVSRAFSRPETVGETTLRRVLAVAEEAGYRPRPFRTRGAHAQTGNIAVVIPDIANPYFPPLLKAVQREALTHRMSLFIGESCDEVAIETRVAASLAKGVDGIIIVSPRMSDDQLRSLHGKIPMALVNRDIEGVPFVVVSSGEGMHQAVTHLVSIGHREIIYLAGPPGVLASIDRSAALWAAARETGISATELGPFEPTYEAGNRAGDMVLAADCPAVIAYNDLIALGLMARLAERGRLAGRDFSVVGFDDGWPAATAHPPLTTVRSPIAEAGALAARQLFDQLSGHTPPGGQVLHSQLIIRATTAPTEQWKGGSRPDPPR
jgi:DNA-binding LacI/PurR family transcriptional regulator